MLNYINNFISIFKIKFFDRFTVVLSLRKRIFKKFFSVLFFTRSHIFSVTNINSVNPSLSFGAVMGKSVVHRRFSNDLPHNATTTMPYLIT